MTEPRKPASVLRKDEIASRSATFRHPWNADSEMHGYILGRTCGLQRSGINLITIPPGKESFVLHAHLHEEEWIYVISGRGVVAGGDHDIELSAGDFIAFPTPSQPHVLRNLSGEPVVYLTGGERADYDVVDYPDHGKRMVRLGERATVYELAGGTPFPFPGIDPL